MKKKITVPTLNTRLFAFSASHSALCLLGALLFAVSFQAEAQPSRTVRIGYLGNNESRSGLTAEGKDFLEELRRRGWIEGQNLVVDQRYWENRVDRLLAQASELVSQKVDIIVTNTGTAARAAKTATTAIPIVMVSSADAVNQGLIISLARPGGNVTGLTAISSWVAGKQLELLREAFPGVSLVAVLNCGGSRAGLGFPGVGKKYWGEAKDAARVQKIQLFPVTVRGPGEIGDALSVVIRERADALLVGDCVRVPAAEFVELAAKRLLPRYTHTATS
jgi:putative tryptophan/tyrosine transport system substrate-binding protein